VDSPQPFRFVGGKVVGTVEEIPRFQSPVGNPTYSAITQGCYVGKAMNSTGMIAATGLLAFAYIFWSTSPPAGNSRAPFVGTLTKCGIFAITILGLLADLGPATEFFGGMADLWPGITASAAIVLLAWRYVGCERRLRRVSAQLTAHNKALLALADGRYLRFSETIRDVHWISQNGDTYVTRTFTTRALPGEIVPWRVFSLGSTTEDQIRAFEDIQLQVVSEDGGSPPAYFPIQENSKILRAMVIPPRPIQSRPYPWKVSYEWPGLFKRLCDHGEDSHNLELKWDHYESVTQVFVLPERTNGSFKNFPEDGQCEQIQLEGRSALVWRSDNPARGAHEFTIQLESVAQRPSDSTPSKLEA
jgi:hypothetical protein